MHEIITHAHKELTKGAHCKSVSDLSLRCKVAKPTLSHIREKYMSLSFRTSCCILYRYAFIFLRFYVPFVDSFIGSNFVIFP